MIWKSNQFANGKRLNIEKKIDKARSIDFVIYLTITVIGTID